MSQLHELLLPPFETYDHFEFATSALLQCSLGTNLAVLELPDVDPALPDLDEFFTAVSNTGLKELRSRGRPTLALVATVRRIVGSLETLRRVRLDRVRAGEVIMLRGAVDMVKECRERGVELVFAT